MDGGAVPVGKLVWAKFKNYPWWPAKTISLEQVAKPASLPLEQFATSRKVFGAVGLSNKWRCPSTKTNDHGNTT